MFVSRESQAYRRVFYPASGYYLLPCQYTKTANNYQSHSCCVDLIGAVSRFYHDFERFKNTRRSYITQQKWFYFGRHHSTNDNDTLGSEDGH